MIFHALLSTCPEEKQCWRSAAGSFVCPIADPAFRYLTLYVLGGLSSSAPEHQATFKLPWEWVLSLRALSRMSLRQSEDLPTRVNAFSGGSESRPSHSSSSSSSRMSKKKSFWTQMRRHTWTHFATERRGENWRTRDKKTSSMNSIWTYFSTESEQGSWKYCDRKVCLRGPIWSHLATWKKGECWGMFGKNFYMRTHILDTIDNWCPCEEQGHLAYEFRLNLWNQTCKTSPTSLWFGKRKC